MLASIGAGGMGEVYRARDTKLNRNVALKILPDIFTSDPDRLARFRREAQLLASLNHPNIAQIHGFEDSGATHALVLELVDGPTLADRIALGPLPLAEALPIARQIADALTAAHEQGVIHRDLKPANIKVKEDGTVKVLDFGLAKAAEADSGTAALTTADLEVRRAYEQPTMTSPAMTAVGMILGTAAYMSPEQARGKSVDRRADVWAFGCVFFEMLTGQRAFPGDDITDVIAAVIKDSPSHAALPPNTPPAIRRLVRRCLEKDRARRLDSMAVARLEIDDALTGADGRDPLPGSTPHRPRRVALLMIVSSLIVGLIAAVAVWTALQPFPAAVQRLSITPPPDLSLAIETNHADIAIAEDGSRLVYFARDTSPARLGGTIVVRSMERYEARGLEDLGSSPRSPFLSPDGAWLGYQSGGASSPREGIFKIPVAGGARTLITSLDGNLRGVFWGRDRSIVFATHNIGTGLIRVSENGGTPETITVPAIADGEADHLWPYVLPDGKHVLFAIRRNAGGEPFDIALLSLDTKRWRVIIKGGTSPRYIPPGYIVYAQAGVVRAVGFDLDTLQVTTEPVQVLDGVVTKDSGAADFAISRSGTFVYLPGRAGSLAFNLAFLARDGTQTPIPVPARAYRNVSPSRDGRFLAASIETESAGSNDGLWTIDLSRGASNRLTPPGIVAMNPVWHPDGQSIAYWAPPGKEPGGIFQIATTGTGTPQRLTTATDAEHRPTAWTPDGRHLLFTKRAADGADIYRVVLGDTIAIEPVVAGPAPEGGAKLSPDGRWMLYGSGETGQSEAHLRPYPDVNQHRTPVAGAGIEPFWGRDAREIILVGTGGVTVMSIDSSPRPSLASPRPFFQSPPPVPATSIDDVMAGADRFVITTRVGPAETPPSEYRVILNWITELEALMRSTPRK